MTNYQYFRTLATGCYKQLQVAVKPERITEYQRWFDYYQAKAKNELSTPHDINRD